LPKENFFASGGTLAPEHPSYIRRLADEQLFVALTQHKFVSVLDARQKGKSSLVARTISRLEESGHLCIKLDLQRYGSNLTQDQWCAGIATAFQEQLPKSKFFVDYRKECALTGPINALFGQIRLLPSHLNHPVTIFADEIDFVRVLPFPADGFFAAIRSLYNERSQNTNLDRLTWCLIGSASPFQLVQSQAVAPFDIAQTIILEDFTPDDLAQYANHLGPNPTEAKKLLKQIHAWCGGHPFLTQYLCSILHQSDSPDFQKLHSIISTEFIHRSGAETNPHLHQVATGFLSPAHPKQEEFTTTCLLAYKKILKKPQPVTSYPKDVVSHLRLSGLVTVNDNLLAPRNNLYQRVFNETWITNHLPTEENRRQKIAARRATLRVGAIASVVCSALGWLALSNQSLANQAQAALSKSELNQKQLQEQVYLSAIQAANSQVNLGNWIAATKTLQAAKNYPDKNWEWHYLNQLTTQYESEIDLKEPTITVVPIADTKLFTAFRKTGTEIFTPTGSKSYSFQNSNQPIRTVSRTGQFITRLVGENNFEVVSSTGNQIKVLRGTTVGFTQDDRGLFILNPEKTLISLFNTRTWLPERSLKINQSVYSLYSSSTTSDWIITNPTSITRLNPTTNQVRWKVTFPESTRILSYFKKTHQILIGLTAGPMRSLNYDTGKVITEYKDSGGPIMATSQSENGQFTASGSANGTVYLYETNKSEPIGTLVGHPGRINSLWFFDNDTMLATSSDDGTLRTWKIPPKLLVTKLNLGTPGPNILITSPSSGYSAVSDILGRVRLITSKSIVEKEWLSNSPTLPRILFDPNADLLAIASKTFGLITFNPNNSQERTLKGVFKSEVEDVESASHNGQTYFASLEADGRLLIFNNYDSPQEVKAPNSQPMRIAMSPNGQLICSINEDGSVSIFSVETRGILRTIPVHSDKPRYITFSPNSKLISTVSNDETATIIDAQSGRIVHTLVGHTSRLFMSKFSPNSRQLVTTSFDGTVRQWDAITGKQIHVFQHKSWISDASFSADGKRIVTCGNDHIIHVWDAESGLELLSLTDYSTTVNRCHFTSDGSSLISVDADGNLINRVTEFSFPAHGKNSQSRLRSP
jgi:WD40 repeat protein